MRPRRVSNRNNNQAKIGQKIITDDDNNLDPDWKLDESIVSKKRKRPPRIGNGTKQCLKKDYITCDTLLDFNSPKENLDTVVGDETEEKDSLNKAQSFDLSSVKNYEIKESIISKKRKRPRRIGNGTQQCLKKHYITFDTLLDLDFNSPKPFISKERGRPPSIKNGTQPCAEVQNINCDSVPDLNSTQEYLDTVVGDETEEKDPLNSAQSFDLSSVKKYEIKEEKEEIIDDISLNDSFESEASQTHSNLVLAKNYETLNILEPMPTFSAALPTNGIFEEATVHDVCSNNENGQLENLDAVVGDEAEETDPLNSAQSFDLSSVKKYEIKEEKEEIIDDISLNDSFESEASQTHSNLVLAMNYETLNILEPMPTFSAALPTNGIFEEATVHDVCSNNENGQLISVCEDEDTISISSVECCGNGTNYEVFVGDFNSSGGKESPITIRDHCTSHRIINDENFRSTKTMELSSNTDQDNEETKKEIYDSSTTLENLDIMYYSNILKVMKVMFTNKINSFEPRVLEDPIFKAMYTENLHNPVSDHTKIEILKKLAYGITLFEKIKNKDPTILSIRNCFNPAKLYVLLDTVKEICENFEQVEIYGSPVEALSWFLHAAGAKITNNVISGSDHERIKETFVRDVNIVLEVINSNWGGLSILKSSKPDKSTPGVVVGLSSVFINSAKPSDENDSLSCLENDFIQSNETIIHSIDKLDDNLLRETLLKKPIPTMGTNTDQSSSNNSVSNTNKESHFNEKNKRNYFRDKLEKESSPQVNILPLKYKMTKSYCLICRRFVPNFIKHILVKHKDREPITQYMALLKENPKGSIMKRKNILRLFQKKNSRAYIRTDPKNMPLDNTPRKSLGETSLKLSKTSQIFSGVLEARENLHIYENSKFIKSGTNSKISLNHHKCNKPVENLAKSESNQTKNNFRKKCESLRTVKQSPSKDTGTKNIEQDSIRIIGNELPAFKQSNNLTNENSLDLTENNYRGQNSVAMGQVGEKPTADICGKSSTIRTENSIKYNNSLTNTTKKSHVPKNYGKKHYCYYCDKSVMRFPRHVIHKHRNEEEVKKINELSLLKNNKEAKSERKELLTELRLKSNHVKIEKLLAERSSQKLSHVIQSWRNYKWGPKALKDIVMCSFCKGIYSKKNFSSHIKRCYSKKKYERGLVAINQVGEKPTSNICGKSSTEKDYLENANPLDHGKLQAFVANSLDTDSMLLNFESRESLREHTMGSRNNLEKPDNVNQPFVLGKTMEDCTLSKDAEKNLSSVLKLNNELSETNKTLEMQCMSSVRINTETLSINNSLTNTNKKSHILNKCKSKHYCFYCDKFIIKFSRHVTHKHKNEEEVKKINELSLLRNNKEAMLERKELLKELRLKSNHVKIEKLLAERSSQKLSHVIHSWRKYKLGPKALKDVVMCSFCKGIYSKKNFSSHIKRCYTKKKYERGLVAINQVGEKPTSNICGKSSTEKNYLEKSKHLDREELQTFVSNNQEKKLIDQVNVLQSKNQTRKNYCSFFKKLVHRKVKMSYSKKISYPNNQNNNHNFSKTLKYACKQTQLTKLSLIRAKNYCLFCKKLVSKFTKHVFIKHKDKEPIMEYMDLMQENTEESLKKGRKIIRLLHLTSNNAYITKNVQSIPSEKTSEEHEKINILLSSKTPQSTEVREDAQKHDSVQLIKYGISSNDDFLLKDISHNTTQGSVTKKYGTFFAMSNVACLTPQASSKFIELLLSRTQKDHISISALNDPLLVSTASSILERFSKDTGFKRAIPFIRDGGALLICAKKIDNTITEFRDLLKPSKLNTVFEATKEICGLDEKTGNIKFTSKPFRVTYVINQASAQVLEEASTNTSLSENCRMQIKKDIDEFLDLKRAKFRSIITHWPASKKPRKTSAIIESDKSSTNKRGRGSIKKRKIYSSSESEESSSEELEGECKELHKRENKRRINSEEKHQVVSNSSAKDGSSFFTKKKWSEPQKRIVIVEFKDFIMNGTNPGRKRCRQLIASCDELAGRTPDQVNLIIDNINKGKLKLPPEFQYLKSNHL